MSGARHSVPVLAALLAACAIACGSSATDDDADIDAKGEDALIGGATASAADFPATVYLKRGCTAAKVAPKLLLTAAHCVVDGFTNEPKYGPETSLEVAREPAKGFVSRGVAKVHVHPVWMQVCASSYCSSSNVTAVLDAADVAVIELADELAGIAIAPVDTTPLAPRDSVTVLGFGCTEGVLVRDGRTPTDVALKFADTKIVPGSQGVFAGSSIDPSKLAQVTGIYAMTPGPSRTKGAAGLCPGDSGGPLYRRKNDALVVVGVNANYTLRADDVAGLPVTNMHTRLDDESRHGIAAWLRSVGAAR